MKKAKYITANRRQRGFTMIELMITITLVAILASIAVPSMQTYVLNSRLTGASREVLRTLQTARTEATRRQRNVVVCASANPMADADDITCATVDIAGWIMFEDTNSSGDHEAGEALISIHSIDSSKLTLLGDGTVTYMPNGFASPGGATTIVVCDSRGNRDINGKGFGESGVQVNSVARGVDIVATGRARVTSVLNDINSMLGTIGATCP